MRELRAKGGELKEGRGVVGSVLEGLNTRFECIVSSMCFIFHIFFM